MSAGARQLDGVRLKAHVRSGGFAARGGHVAA